MHWHLHRDLADPELFEEMFVVGSWAEHERQHERLQGRERDAMDAMDAFWRWNVAHRAARPGNQTVRASRALTRSAPPTQRISHQRVCRTIRFARGPPDRHASDSCGELEDLVAEGDELGVDGCAYAREVGDEQAGVASSVDPVEPEFVRVPEPGEQRPVLRDGGADDTDRLRVRCDR